MSGLARIGVAIESDLLTAFDQLNRELGYTNRSEAFRDLIRDRLVKQGAANPNQEVVGALTLVYDHHKRNLNAKLNEIQHSSRVLVISTLHVHLDHSNCLEVLVLRGKARQVRALAEQLISVKGIHHGQLTLSTPGIASGAHGHGHSHG